MEDGLIQFILSKENERKKILYFLLAITLSVIISCKIYGRLIGGYEIISLIDYKRIVIDFFLSGRFIVCLFILIVIYKFFYFLIDMFIFKWLAKMSDKLYETIRSIAKRDGIKEQIIEDFKRVRILNRIAIFGINTLKQLSIIEIVNGTAKPSMNFYSLLDYFKNLNDKNNEESIDTDLAYYPFAITLQILILFDTVVIHNFNFWLVYIILINVWCTPKLGQDAKVEI